MTALRREEGGKLTLLGQEPLPLDDGRLKGGAGGTVAAAGGGGGGGDDGGHHGGGAAGHQGLHARGVQASHAFALVQPQLAGGVLHALPLLEGKTVHSEQELRWFRCSL